MNSAKFNILYLAGWKFTLVPGPVMVACPVAAPPGRVLYELLFPELVAELLVDFVSVLDERWSSIVKS